jgi:NAD+ kinase
MSERPSIQTVALVAAPHKPRALEFVAQLQGELLRRGVSVLVDDSLAAVWPDNAQLAPMSECVAADLVLVLGGDGTLLSVARQAAPLGTALLGVDLGSFGFLAAEDPDKLIEDLDAVLAGRFQIEPRVMLQATVSNGVTPTRLLALNDIVMSKAHQGRLIRVHTALDGQHIATYPADGLIVATATGSTGYNLSAGGPIIDSRLEAIALTPICPHTLYSRPLVVPACVEIALTLETRGKALDEVTVVADGQDVTTLSDQQSVTISRAPFDARLVRLEAGRLYDRLREKLRWGTER